MINSTFRSSFWCCANPPNVEQLDFFTYVQYNKNVYKDDIDVVILETLSRRIWNGERTVIPPGPGLDLSLFRDDTF